MFKMSNPDNTRSSSSYGQNMSAPYDPSNPIGTMRPTSTPYFDANVPTRPTSSSNPSMGPPTSKAHPNVRSNGYSSMGPPPLSSRNMNGGTLPTTSRDYSMEPPTLNGNMNASSRPSSYPNPNVENWHPNASSRPSPYSNSNVEDWHPDPYSNFIPSLQNPSIYNGEFEGSTPFTNGNMGTETLNSGFNIFSQAAEVLRSPQPERQPAFEHGQQQPAPRATEERAV